MAFDTAANVINDAAFELGLISTAITDPYASSVTDPNIILLRYFLKGLGQDLVRAHPWQALQTTHTFSTGSGTASYALPTDYARLTDKTQWNRTSDMPLLGPLSAGDWQLLQAISGTSIDRAFRVFGELVYLSPTPTATETVAFEYISRYWVRRYWQPSTAYVVGDRVVNGTKVYDADTAGTSASATGPVGTSTNEVDGTTRWDYVSALAGAMGSLEYVTWGGDYLLFDRRMLVTGLIDRFNAKQGKDRSNSKPEFQDAFAAAKGGDGAAPVLSLGGRTGYRYIDNTNLPDTGWGS